MCRLVTAHFLLALFAMCPGGSLPALGQDGVTTVQAGMDADERSDDAVGEPLALDQAMHLAAENGVEVLRKAEDVEFAQQERYVARGVLMPQLLGSARYAQIDEDQAAESQGIVPETRSTVGFSLSQVLIHDEALTAFRAATRTWNGTHHEQEAVRLDRMIEGGARFIGLLQARALHRLELDHLGLTRSHLALARLRTEVGATGPEDVHRWEAELAQQEISVLKAAAAVEVAQLAMNEVLNVDPFTQWALMDIAEEETAGADILLPRGLAAVLSESSRRAAFRPYLVEVALRRAPELQALEEFIAAQQMLKAQRQRNGILPTVVARFSYAHALDQDFVTPSLEDDLTAAGIPVQLSDSASEDEWRVMVAATIPLFEGGSRYHDVLKEAAGVRRLNRTRDLLQQRISKRALAAFSEVEASSPSIDLSRNAARSAKANLRFVRLRYEDGAASILDLLDAQRQSIASERGAVIATYGLHLDVLELQRALAWFSTQQLVEEREAFRGQWETFYRDWARE